MNASIIAAYPRTLADTTAQEIAAQIATYGPADPSLMGADTAAATDRFWRAFLSQLMGHHPDPMLRELVTSYIAADRAVSPFSTTDDDDAALAVEALEVHTHELMGRLWAEVS